MPFPQQRPRRLRKSTALRRMVRETLVTPSDLVLPLFVVSGAGVKKEVASMPGVFQESVDQTTKSAQRAVEAGVGAVILFGIPANKDAEGTSAWDEDGPVGRAITSIKQACPDLVVVTDVCMCEYTDHGHCGRLVERLDGQVDVDNDSTLELLAREALMHARAGADIVAPSDMMDGRVDAIRKALDGGGFTETSILSYAAKFASAFYGPFRDAAESAPRSGPSHRHTYQMDPANRREAIREVLLDIDEGADMVMVKPALPYLDIVRDVRDRVQVPVAAYQVSGEYAMIKMAARAGVVDEDSLVLESLTSIKRAGADLILTYYAIHAAQLLQGDRA